MHRTTSFRALFILPLALAFVMAVPSVRAQALDPTQQLNNILRTYAGEEGATTTAALARTTITASADDLVAAVYQYLLNRSLTNQEIVDVAVAALKADGAGKVRADKDKVAARILEAAIIARGAQTDSALIGLLVPAVANVNNTLVASKQLTAAGKEAVIGKALRATSGLGATIGAQADVLSAAAGTATAAPNVKRKTFTIAVLKTLVYKPQVYDPALASTSQATEATKGQLVQLYNGAPEAVTGQPLFTNHGVPPSIAGVRDYIDRVLDLYNPALADSTAKTSEALVIAEGVATNPAVAGAVIGGLIQDQKTGSNDPALQTILAKAIADAKLAAAIADIVENGLSQFAGDKRQAAFLLSGPASAVNKGKIASGAVRASNSQAAGIINDILSPTTTGQVTPAGLAAFATAAATGNGDNGTAAVIATTIIDHVTPKPTAAADLTAIQTIAINVIKAVAPANPDSAFDVAQALFNVQRTIGTNPPANPYSATAANGGTAARAKLAADLAKGAATNYTAAGAAVAGVVAKSIAIDPSTPGLDVSISAAAIKVAAKASLSIAQKVSFNRQNSAGFSTLTFASGLALSTASTNAGAIAAGVSLTDTSHAGDIVKAVITSNGSTTQSAALNKAAFTIANTAAVNVDVEAIADIAQKVGTLLQPKTGATNANLPKITTLGTLATSLAKAINTKPLVTQANRKDELGELAAVLVTASLNLTDGKTPAALAAIGTNIYKAASAKLLADVGNNAVDLADIAGDVAGAIAQTIAHAPLTGAGSLTADEKTHLLGDIGTGSLIKLLSTGAKTFASQVNVNEVNGIPNNSAFDLVRNTETVVLGVHTGNYGYVTGTEAIGTNGTATPLLFSKFEIGAVVDSETPVKNL
ncbi:MAG TPA: hypothetical protein VGO11_15445 [Chthoniobacteraceae bacterium]|nr:hypothetical protein [Chthoniobacteraceae bacterium]